MKASISAKSGLGDILEAASIYMPIRSARPRLLLCCLVVIVVIVHGWGAYGEPLGEIQRHAEEGNIEAQYELACMYYLGKEVEQSYTRAIEWWRMAAKLGHAESQFQLGHNYRVGRGVVHDDAKALEWLHKSADQLNPNALYLLGVLYGSGRNMPNDPAKGMTLLMKAAELGSVSAQVQLGINSEHGQKVSQDISAAYFWYVVAVKEGSGKSKKGELGSAEEAALLHDTLKTYEVAISGRDRVRQKLTTQEAAAAERKAEVWFADRKD